MTDPLLLKVAVVDDDASLCRSFGRLLRAAGVESTAYASAEDFLRDEARSRFHCLVLDVQLGGMSGLELGRKLATEQRHSPIIFVTDHDNPVTRAQAMALGCHAFFKKSDAGSTVLEAIRAAASTHAVS
jgi:FixJ family two-component response regulator